MRTQRCTQLAVVVLLIVTAFPHQYQTQDTDDDNRRTSTAYQKGNDDQTHLRKTNLTRTDDSTHTPSTDPPNEVPKKSESGHRNEEQIEKDPIIHSWEGRKVSKPDPITPEGETPKELGSDFRAGPRKINSEQEATAKKRENSDRKLDGPEQREIDFAVEYGLKRMRDLYFVREPELYKMGLFLEKNHPAYFLASFRAPNEKALNYARYGYAALEARTKLAEIYPESASRESPTTPVLRSRALQDECPLQGIPRCPPGFERYRTSDGTCNNFQNPWRGASLLPMQRFLPPHYDDGIQSVRRSVLGGRLPSPRDISARIHRDKNREMPTITLMFMQWGQFVDHDITSSVQARMFNRSVPRCCEEGGVGMLPRELTHPECLPIPVSSNDWFLSQFGIRCIEFIRSAPTTRIDCDLGWREQISQVTAYIDASTVYGSDPDKSDSLRMFRKGQLLYGRSQTSQGPLQPPDPPEGELCRLGAITTDCFKGGDLRVGDQPGLTAVHTVWLRYHNIIAIRLGALNPHWSDEKNYQESRRIVGALVQHITYREFLPIVLGHEVMRLFDLDLERKGYYKGYSSKVNPAPANSFGTAALRFGHSLVQKSFIRTDSSHRVIRNNVTLHEEQENIENIWSLGSVDRLLLGLANQPTQRRDEFISEELTNHLFQSSGFPFGMDLAAINIQRGRDHGLPSYTAWREPCGLVPLSNWTDLERIMSADTVRRLRSLYEHYDDIDLFSGGLAEKPVRGGIVGPTFACIIAQQFSNLRRGDRFWYENGHFESSFTPAQLQQLRRVTFAHVLCKTTAEIETLQPFVFLSADKFRNVRVRCDDPSVDSFDLLAWAERTRASDNANQFLRRSDEFLSDSETENYEGVTGFDVHASEHKDTVGIEHPDEENPKDNDEDIESRQRPVKKRTKIKLTATVSRRPTTTKATVTRITRPTAYINNRPLSHNTYGPYKIKVTNVTSSTVNLVNKKVKPGSKKRPIIIYERTTKKAPVNKRPLSQLGTYSPQSPPIKRPFPTEKPTVDGYLFGNIPESAPSLNPGRPGSIQPQMGQGQGQTGGHGPYHVNINIQFVPPNGQGPNSDKTPTYGYDSDKFEGTTKRPKPSSRPTIFDPYDQNEQDFTRPNNFYDSPFVTKKPSFSHNRPQNEYGDFHTEQFNARPVYRPPNNYDTVFEDVPFATSSKPYNIYNKFQHKISTMRPVVIPSYLYLNEQENYDPYQQSSRPTYNQRPPYKTDEDSFYNSNSDSNTHVLTPGAQNFRPNVNNFNPQYKQGLNNFNTEDQLDMTDFATFADPSKTDEDNRFVKISSIQGQKFATADEMKKPIYISVQQREGELELEENHETSSESPLIQVDVVPSEVRTDEWEIYNESDDIAPALSIFDLIDFNTNSSTVSELPKPINFDFELK